MYNYCLMGKYPFKCLPMVFINSSDILLQKMNDLLQAFEFIRAHIENLLFLEKVFGYIK